VAPEGCFPVYVGPKKQKFVIKIEYANHSLFQMLLEEAESEYGYDKRKNTGGGGGGEEGVILFSHETTQF
jgi:hypothetical protein